MLSCTLLVFCSLIGAFATTSEGLVSPDNASLLWGPYRPNLYLGIRPRIPNSLLMGLMWSNIDDPTDISKNLRHTCEQNEGMAGYGWTTYDVRKGGAQVINDTGNRLDLITKFAKLSDDERGGKWGLRIEGIPRANARDHQKTTVIFYIGSEDPNSRPECRERQRPDSAENDVFCDGRTTGLPVFKLRISDHRADGDSLVRMSVKSLTVPADTIWQAKSIFTNQIKGSDSGEGVLAHSPGEGNLHYVQKVLDGRFEFDILFSSDPISEGMTSSSLTDGIQDAASTFNERFQSVYPPQAPFQDEQYIKFSQSLISNLMGGIGYFHGTSKVDVSPASDRAETDERFWEQAASLRSHAVVEEQGPHALYTAIPSRPFFPRGFLWDEGFHLQVILEWDMDLALEIVSSWFDLMDENGWIAREQILGAEARSKVPSEFQTQYQHYANPPTLFAVMEAFVSRLSGALPYSGAPSRHLSDAATGKAFLTAIYPKLKKHYDWFRQTQAGNLTRCQFPGLNFNEGYRWQGRTPQHTLTSGLDDYPRAQPPHPEELHVDALCWVGSMAMALGKMSTFLDEHEDRRTFSIHEIEISRSIDGIHWSEPDAAYCDTTVVVDDDDGSQAVKKVCHKGYISLFPFLVGLMDPHHPHLAAVLNLLRDPAELWSPHGLRSLSRRDSYYGTDENYWRGPVWININYMAVERLLTLASQPGPHAQAAREIYTSLRLNLVNTVFDAWKETGFAWEQYDPDTGKGQRTQHFTGWTALIVKILAMPDLHASSHPGYVRPSAGPRGWGVITLPLAVVGMLLICFVFRRRVTRFWRGLMRT